MNGFTPASMDTYFSVREFRVALLLASVIRVRIEYLFALVRNSNTAWAVRSAASAVAKSDGRSIVA